MFILQHHISKKKIKFIHNKAQSLDILVEISTSVHSMVRVRIASIVLCST